LEQKKIRLFYINKTEYKTSYATAIVDRFIRTIKDELERYQKLNDTKTIIQAVKDIAEGYNNTEHRMLKKSPNEMTKDYYYYYYYLSRAEPSHTAYKRL